MEIGKGLLFKYEKFLNLAHWFVEGDGASGPVWKHFLCFVSRHALQYRSFTDVLSQFRYVKKLCVLPGFPSRQNKCIAVWGRWAAVEQSCWKFPYHCTAQYSYPNHLDFGKIQVQKSLKRHGGHRVTEECTIWSGMMPDQGTRIFLR